MSTTTNVNQFKVVEWELVINEAADEFELFFRVTVCFGGLPCSATLQKFSAELLKLALDARKAGY